MHTCTHVHACTDTMISSRVSHASLSFSLSQAIACEADVGQTQHTLCASASEEQSVTDAHMETDSAWNHGVNRGMGRSAVKRVHREREWRWRGKQCESVSRSVPWKRFEHRVFEGRTGRDGLVRLNPFSRQNRAAAEENGQECKDGSSSRFNFGSDFESRQRKSEQKERKKGNAAAVRALMQDRLNTFRVRNDTENTFKRQKDARRMLAKNFLAIHSVLVFASSKSSAKTRSQMRSKTPLLLPSFSSSGMHEVSQRLPCSTAKLLRSSPLEHQFLFHRQPSSNSSSHSPAATSVAQQ